MWVSRLSLRDFRSYVSLDVELSAGVTTFVAPNGSGKTNLVEALGYLSALRSHRVSQDLPLVRHATEQATVSALAHRGQRQVTVEVTIKARGANRSRVNRQPVRVREIIGLLPSVVFAPEDLSLVRGEPGDRRDFLDTLLVGRQPRFAGVIADFERALRQRNALLKSLRAEPNPALEATLDIWDQAFAEAAAQLVIGRRALLADLREPLAENFAYVAAEARTERRQATAEYSSRIDYTGVTSTADARDVIVEALLARRRPETERGLTLVGPQRDDVLLSIGAVPAKGYASHGESWSLALALRLAGWELLRGDSDDPADQPVLILDDVFAELDAGRRRRLAAKVVDAEQVLITAAVAGDVPEELSATIVDLLGLGGQALDAHEDEQGVDDAAGR
ncbi:DNA replication/repair protein RecF [Brevibacterium daeguense]|uniref:DNA replication and repair protein RecF n=1 Tax=Brevibacterium daeguense TaxID=909936 RepID=A0ABP8EF82_9MICO|nr:DNA replication/repair protein RecF [Brevibacterium daeguense]